MAQTAIDAEIKKKKKKKKEGNAAEKKRREKEEPTFQWVDFFSSIILFLYLF